MEWMKTKGKKKRLDIFWSDCLLSLVKKREIAMQRLGKIQWNRSYFMCGSFRNPFELNVGYDCTGKRRTVNPGSVKVFRLNWALFNEWFGFRFACWSIHSLNSSNLLPSFWVPSFERSFSIFVKLSVFFFITKPKQTKELIKLQPLLSMVYDSKWNMNGETWNVCVSCMRA